MKSRARATATGVSVGLTIGTLVWACTSLPEITAIPTDSGTATDVGPATDAGAATDGGDTVTTCPSFLAATKLPGRWAFGPVAGSAVTYVEAADGTPEIAWVGKCDGAIEPTIYRTPLSGFSPKEIPLQGLPAADLCAGAKPFGTARIRLQGAEDVTTLIPSDRNPSFLCALVAGNGVLAPPFGPSSVQCFGSNPNATRVERSGNFIGLFRSKEFGPATIRAAFAGPVLGEVNTFVASEGTGGTVIFSQPIKVGKKAPPAASTAAIASTGAAKDDSFVLFDQSSAILTRFASDGTTPFDYSTSAAIPTTLLWGETVFGDTNGAVLIAGLEGPLTDGLRPRIGLFLPTPPTDPRYIVVTDLEGSGRDTYRIESGGFERLVLVPGTDAPGTGAAIVAVRGIADKKPISALVLAKPGSGTLLPSETNTVRIAALPSRYGLAGSIPTDTKQKASIYLGISADAMRDWSKGLCTSGMVVAFEP